MREFQIAIGLILVVLVLYDVFAAIVVPRQTSSALRLGPFLMSGILWPIYLKLVSLKQLRKWRSELLAQFVPGAFAVIMIVWLLILMLGFACILYGMRNDVSRQLRISLMPCTSPENLCLRLGLEI